MLRDVKSFIEKQPGAWAPSRLFTAASRQVTARTLQDKLEEFLKELQVGRLALPCSPPSTTPSLPSPHPVTHVLGAFFGILLLHITPDSMLGRGGKTSTFSLVSPACCVAGIPWQHKHSCLSYILVQYGIQPPLATLCTDNDDRLTQLAVNAVATTNVLSAHLFLLLQLAGFVMNMDTRQQVQKLQGEVMQCTHELSSLQDHLKTGLAEVKEKIDDSQDRCSPFQNCSGPEPSTACL